MTASAHLKTVSTSPGNAVGGLAREDAYRAVGDLPAGHPAVAQGRIGVLLVNLGTPDAPTASAVRRYLAEFLSDTRIVDYPRALWLPLLHGVILNVRPAKTAKAYAEIWRAESNESPLRYFTRHLAERLGERMAGRTSGGASGNASTASAGQCPHSAVASAATPTTMPAGARGLADAASATGPVLVDYAMRYGTPAIADRIRALQAAGCDRLLVLPLYPQYSSTTTASVNDAVFDALKSMKWQPALRVVPAFHDRPAYIDALAQSLHDAFRQITWTPERVVLSFHGVPERLLTEGDPYHCHCAKTARLLRQRMGWDETFAPLTFQSRFGPEKWLGPATDDTIDRLAEDGVRNIAVITPGFVSDCLETLEEIGIAAAESFHAKGGVNFLNVPCLNSSDPMIDLAESLVADELAGWIAARA